MRGNPVGYLGEYELRHLVEHLEASRRADELHRLLALETSEQRNAWYEARDQLGQTAGYQRDVDLAWQMAEASSDIAGQVRYALIYNSVNTVSSTIPAPLLARAIESGLLPLGRGLALLLTKPNVDNRVEALKMLAPVVGKQSTTVVVELLASVLQIELEAKRTDALIGLVQYLPENMFSEVLELARKLPETDRVRGYSPRVKALVEISKCLQGSPREQIIAEALNIARNVEPVGFTQSPKARALASVAPHLSEPMRLQVLREALAATRQLERRLGSAIWATLGALAPELPQDLLDEALTISLEIEDAHWRGVALIILFPYLSESTKGRIWSGTLAALREGRDEHHLASALIELSPHIPKELLAEALAEARMIQNKKAQARALSGLIPQLAEPLRTRILHEALAAVQAMEDKSDQPDVLARLLPHLMADLLQETWILVMEETEYYKARALTSFAPHLPENLLTRATEMAGTFEDPEHRAKALLALAPYLWGPLKEKVLEESLKAVQKLWRRKTRTTILAEMTPHLPERMLSAAFETAQLIGDKNARMRTLASLAAYLPVHMVDEAIAAVREAGEPNYQTAMALRLKEPHKSKMLEETLKMTRQRKEHVSPRRRARSMELANLSEHLPEPLKARVLDEALASVRELPEGITRAEALRDLLPYLSESSRETVLNEILTSVQNIEWEWFRVTLMASLAPYLSEKLIEQVLENVLSTIRSDTTQLRRARPLISLVPYLPEPRSDQVTDQALNLLREYGGMETTDRVLDLCDLSSHLSDPQGEELLKDALRAVQDVIPGLYRSDVLYNLASRLLVLSCDTLENLWLERQNGVNLLRALSCGARGDFLVYIEAPPNIAARNDLLEDIQALVPVIVALGGDKAATGVFRAIQDVGRWWP